jgi:Zn-dependent protease with chaperone function
MTGSNLMQGCAALAGSLATIALILTAFGLMLGIVKPADVPKRIGVILSIVVTLMVIPGVLVSAWSGVSLWQQIALIAIGIGAFQWLRPRRQSRKRKKE